MNQIVLGTIYEGKLCSVHRLDEETERGWPVKYWPDGPDGWRDSGWYYYNSDGEIEGTFSYHPFDGEPFDYPLITAYDPEYRSTILLVVVMEYQVSEPEFTVMVKPPSMDNIKTLLKEFAAEYVAEMLNQ